MSASEKYEIVIGLEVHAQLLTASKAYNTDPSSFGENPNENVGLVTLALPGTLPKTNTKVVDFAIRMGLACGCEITRYNYYDRKNYFYPDLPKGYQITQDKTPICRGGHIDIELKDVTQKRIAITRIHMEEDAGKSLHLAGAPESLIDLNRAGTPLIEIVSEPEMRSAQEAYAYLVEVHRLVRYLDICDGNMEEGSFRCDANISVMLKGASEFGKKVEVKNMNSFRNVARAIEKETERQIALVEAGEEVISETRMFDGGTGETYSLRSKESLNDYRYFPEPDLLPVVVDDAHLARVRALLPALPKELFALFTTEFALSPYDARVLIEERETADYFLAVTKLTKNYKAASNWITGPMKALQNAKAITLQELSLSAQHLAELIELIDMGKLSFSVASQRLLPILVETGENPLQAAVQHNLIMDQDAAGLEPIIRQIMDRYPDKVLEYKAGKKGLLGLFVGEVMKATKGKANPKDANRLVTEALEA
jgi:aspartyl-tRNA(Asn)/glutamyl-tRNA(Gln) amidotransferase subunit B